ncbi:hypothetical protein [Dongia deserti]|uniref:hypothetical protein n=1 Tax=Dongia deserti TaxID=2268030 RepID=UPI000E6498E5|nr:hypothetical protein [Dongia deserti]
MRSRDGVDFWLLGLAVPADELADRLSEAFQAKESAEIENWTAFWAGKWLLVSKDCCWQDASGCLGVNYRHIDRNVWLSSSAELLSEHLPDAPRLPWIRWQIAHSKGVDWIPAPATTRDGVYKLLPQRVLDPRSGSIRAVRFVCPDRDSRDDSGALATALKIVMANWGRCDFSESCVALTAGLDTRTVLAAAHAAGIAFRATTTSFPSMDRCDRTLPPKLAASIDVPHVFRRLRPFDEAEVKARAAAISEHVGGATAHPIFDHFARFDHAIADHPGRTSATGSCFEIGRCFFWNKFSRAGLGEARPTADQILQAFSSRSTWRPQPIEAWRQALESWVESLADPVPLVSDWRDRFHLDQRLGSWNCNVQRTNDFSETTGFNPANCLWIYYLLLQPDPIRREQGTAQLEAIELLEPRLLRFPINPAPISDRLKDNAKALLGPQIIRGVRSFKSFIKAGRAH